MGSSKSYRCNGVTELQQNRYDQLLRRVGDLKGPGSKVSEVLTELFPVLDVENVPGELMILSAYDLAFGGAARAGAAGEQGRVQIFNPVGSGKIMTVTKMLVSVSLGQDIRWGISNVALDTAPQLQFFRDTRKDPFKPSLPTGQIRTQSSVAAAPATCRIAVLIGDSFTLEDVNGLAVLSAGFGLEVGTTTLATEITACFYWRERTAEPSELNL